MAALFSLGTGQQPDEEDHHRQQQDSGDPGAAGGVVNNNNNRSLTSNGGLCLYRDEEIYGPKGLEIWQHQQQQQQQSYHRQRGSSGGQHQPAPSLGIGYFSAAGASGVVDFRGGAGAGPTTSFNVFGDERSQSGVPTMMMMREVQQQGGFGCGVGVGVGGGGGINCQDCGNQAKKDCAHLRCRTCCKSRGFHCTTHVKSTWVPAAKRRERQQHLASLQHKPRGGDHGTAKRTRETPSSSSLAAAAPRLPAAPSASSSGLEVGQFPAEVNSAAVFRCVRLNAMDEGDDQIAYQTTLPIGGHLFKGILYDHGPEDSGGYSGGGGGGNSSGGTHHQHDHAYHHQLHQQQFNLIEAMAATAASSTAAANPEMLDPSLYTAPLNAFMSGTQFFQPPRS